MKHITKVLSAVIFTVLVIATFRSWFTAGLLAGGDFQVYYKEMFSNFFFFPPPSWSWTLGAGLGVNGSSLLWNYIVVQLPIVLLGNLGFGWAQIQRAAFLYPYLILSIVLPYYFARKLFSPFHALLATLLFSFNTYILMLVGGGQIFLSLAYVLIPPVFYYFYILLTKGIKNDRALVKTISIASLLISLQVLFDLRIAYVTLAGIFLFAVVNTVLNRQFKNLLLLPLVLCITGFLHAFWLFPTMVVRQNPLASFGEEYVSSGIVKFLSFAKFENTISLLQPNWPENIFGKVYFMRPEFLVLPVLAFSSLLFLRHEKKEKKVVILFFAFAALVGAFLAKGTNEPLGGLYDFLFTYIPGFMMFRDPTKWYPMVAISYSFLIPYSVMHIYNLLARYKKYSKLFLLITILYLLFLITPTWTGQLGGIFKSTQVPAEYIKLEQFLSQDRTFYRTFWVPGTSTYSFYSVIHPITTGYDFTREYSAKEIIKTMSGPKFETILQDISVKYVIVPDDTEGMIFLKDRKYNALEYKKTVEQIRKIPYLREVQGFDGIKVFEVSRPHEHIWSEKAGLISDFVFKNPTLYEVDVKSAKKGDVVVLSENYDKNWVIRNSSFTQHSIPVKVSSNVRFKNRVLNGFMVQQDGSYSFEMYYTVQDWVNIGTVVSGMSLVSIVLILIWSHKKKK